MLKRKEFCVKTFLFSFFVVTFAKKIGEYVRETKTGSL